MPTNSHYRGVLRVAGPNLKGWLIDVARPARRVQFDLVVDGQPRGSHVADAQRRLFGTAKREDTHGFTIPIRKPWITGKEQQVRLVDPSDPMLDFSMMLRLGPRPLRHFEDHVIGGHVSLGQAERIQDDDEAETAPAPARANKALLKQIGALSDADLASLLGTIEREILLERLTRHEKADDWQGLSLFKRQLAGAVHAQSLVALARGAVKAHNPALAARAAGAAAMLHPASFDANYLAGTARAMQDEFDEALDWLRAADRLEEDGTRAKREMAHTLARQLREELPVEKRRAIRDEHLAVLRVLSTSSNVATQVKYHVPYATALYAAGRYDEAMAAADQALDTLPNDTRALMVKARTLVARNRVGEACQLYERVLDIDPQHRGARQSLRILAALADDETREHESVKAVHRRRLALGDGDLAGMLSQVPQNWICTGDAGLDEADQIASRLDDRMQKRVGYVEIARGDGRMLEFWHRDALRGLAESGLIASLEDRQSLDRWKPFYEAERRNGRAAGRGVAVLVSHNGADLYGGGEHFLTDAAEHHAAQGFEPLILGTRPELEGEERRVNGRRATFIGDQPADMRRFLLENGVSLVHAISGMGFTVAEALNFTNIPFFYGVHFWNELLGDPQTPGYFDEVSGEALFRREFLVILSRATAVYANSRYTQKVIEDGFGVRCPVLYAVPRERPPVANP